MGSHQFKDGVGLPLFTAPIAFGVVQNDRPTGRDDPQGPFRASEAIEAINHDDIERVVGKYFLNPVEVFRNQVKARVRREAPPQSE